jgi:hypothetical protein
MRRGIDSPEAMLRQNLRQGGYIIPQAEKAHLISRQNSPTFSSFHLEHRTTESSNECEFWEYGQGFCIHF